MVLLAALVHFTDMSLLNFVHAAVLVVPQVMLNVGYGKQNAGGFYYVLLAATQEKYQFLRQIMV